jgi:hypothetical protein
VSTCFVMQPFDQGVFDQRYEDVFAPAIRDAGLEPYRVDQDPKVSIPIQDIELGIRDAAICLAEITQDNPNVWFELGFALACGKEVVLVCSKERTTKFPFDVQHRMIINYPTGAPRDFKKLQKDITARIKAYLQKVEKLSAVAEISKVEKFEGLEQHEVVCIAAIAENLDHPDDHTSAYQVKRDMEASGFTNVATTIALASLLKKEFISHSRYRDYPAEDYYTGYSLTETGWTWVLANKDKFKLRKPEDDDIPPLDDDIPS